MPRTQPRARRRARGPRGGSPNACSCRSSVHSFHGFLLPNALLDDAARSRPVLHDVATGQVRHARVAVMLAPPAHGIAAGVLPTATIVVAHRSEEHTSELQS